MKENVIAGQFSVLIGSYARGTATLDSDVDILRIGHVRQVPLPIFIPKDGVKSFIDYDQVLFTELYDSGSLFLKHVFQEGILLEGRHDEWLSIKENFKVAEVFDEEIRKYAELLLFSSAFIEYRKAVIPYLSTAFKAAKNIGIFHLASNKVFVFDKKMALVNGCGIELRDAEMLLRANQCYERFSLLPPPLRNKRTGRVLCHLERG